MPLYFCEYCNYFETIESEKTYEYCRQCSHGLSPKEIVIPKAYITDNIQYQEPNIDKPFYGYTPLLWNKASLDFEKVDKANLKIQYLSQESVWRINNNKGENFNFYKRYDLGSMKKNSFYYNFQYYYYKALCMRNECYRCRNQFYRLLCLRIIYTLAHQSRCRHCRL